MFSKITISHKLISIICIFSILLSIFMNVIALNTAATESKSSNEKILFESDYSSAIVRANSSFLPKTGGDVYPIEVSSNKVLGYRPGWYCAGQVVLGSDYAGGNDYIQGQAIKAEAGKTYEVEFDYYLKGSSGNPAVKFGLAIGSVGSNNTNAPKYSYVEQKVTFTAGTNIETGSWVRDYQITYTVPADADFTNGDKLLLYFQYGSTGGTTQIYIDNVKVVELASESKDLTLFQSGYDTANWDADAVYNSYVGGPIATKDPLNSSNKVMMKSSGVPSAFVLGMNYYAESVKSPNCYSLVDKEAIKIEAGKTYVVKLDYYYDFTGNYKAVPLLLSTGKLSEKSGPSGTISYDEALAKTVFTPEINPKPSSWTKGAEFEITIPEDYKTSDYPYLVLYTKSETRFQKYYIDNVSVKVTEKTTEPEQPEEDFTKDEVIFESDYSTATRVKGLTGDDLWNAIDSHKKSSIGIFPYVNPFDGNDTSLVRNGFDDYAAVYLGADYVKPETIRDQAIKVKPGVTYRVQFDYYAQVVTQGQLPTNPLKIYLAAGNTVATGGAWPGYKIEREKNSQVQIVAFEANKDYGMTTWKTETVDITIPADLDTEKYPFLILDTELGTKNGRVYFDNVKVTQLAGKIEISTNNGYDDALVQENAQNSIFKSVSGDFYPSIDPLKSGNKVMKYSQGTNNRSMLFVGASYKNAKDIPVETVTAVAGQTYTITFDYYIEGVISHEDGLKIGVGVGDTKYIAPNGKASGYNQTMSLNKGEGSMSGWTRDYKVTYTVPVGSTLENGNKLFIYAQNGRGANLYIDNVKVEISEEIITGDGDGTYRVKFETNGGKPLPDMDFNLVTSNVVLGYRPSYFGAGQLLLGTDYNNNANVISSSMSVEKGASYEIKFDYYAKGEISSSDFVFGIAIGASDGHKTSNPLYSYTEEKVKYPSGQTVSTEGWIRDNRYIFKVPENLDLSVGNKLMFYFKDGKTGQFNFYLDNIKVTRLDGQNKVLFESNYNDTTPRTDVYWTSYQTSSGDVFPKPDPLGGVASLPIPENETGIFVEWCVDKELLNPVNENSFYGTAPITLYAKWRFYNPEITINVDDCAEYWSPNGNREIARMDYPVTITKDGNNAVLKYKMKYSKKQVREFDNCQGETTCFDGAVIGLFDPSVFANDATAKSSDAAYLVKQGGTYYVQFKYKALSVDPDSTVSTRLYFDLGVTSETSCYLGIKKMTTLRHSSNAPDSEWKTAGGFITIDDISSSGNRLSIFCYGLGEVLIDDITIVRVNNGLAFETYGGTPTKPVYGNVGDTIKMPDNPIRNASKFLGWYLDEEFTKPYANTAKISEGVTKLYAKFLTYQTIQSFEDYQRGKNSSIQHYYYINRLTDDNTWVENHNWLGSKFQKDKVRSGKASIVAWGETQYDSTATFFDCNIPLTVGEDYTLSFWVNLEDMMLPADIQLVHSNDISNLTDPEWDKNAFGPRFESMISTSYLENHKNEWVEIRYDFKAKAPYVGVSIPGLTKVWIDDACITLKSADASYKRSIDGPGISYDELVNINLDEDEEVKETSKIIIKPATAEVESGGNLILMIVIIGSSVIVIVAAILAFVLIRKRRIIK